ncbi:hypothetical protein C7B80_28090 [Cyanosarcina cf. burmensis CCALA 770]|nr:hypothetical protein C7B80_28090 [Cyanosarcina cf. burmensis CCALA 770]
MANITIANLQPAGLDLFYDSDNYMKDLTEAELGIQGGGFRTWLSYLGSLAWDLAKTFVSPEDRAEISKDLEGLIPS